MLVGSLKRRNILEIILTWIGATLYGSGEKIYFFNIKFEVIGAIWFLLSLFWTKLYYSCIDRIKNKRVKYITLFISSIFGFVLTKYIWLPFSLNTMFICVVFYSVGRIFCEEKIFDKKYSKIFLINSIIGFIFCSYWCKTNVATNYYNLYYFNMFDGILGAFLLIYFCSKLKIKFLNSFFAWCGKNSLYILCFHTIEGRGLIPWKSLINIENTIFTIFMRISVAIVATYIYKYFMEKKRGKEEVDNKKLHI